MTNLYLIDFAEKLSDDSLPTNLQVLREFYFRKEEDNIIPSNSNKKSNAIRLTAERLIEIYVKYDLTPLSLNAIKNKLNKLLNAYESRLKSKNKPNESTRQSLISFKASPHDLFDIKAKSPTKRQKDKERFIKQVTKERERMEDNRLISWDDIDLDVNDQNAFEPESDHNEFDSNEFEPDQTSDCQNLIENAVDMLSDNGNKDPEIIFNFRNILTKKFRILSDDMLTTLDRIQISNRNAFRLIAAVLKELKIDLNNVVLSKLTLNKKRRAFREKFYRSFKKKLKFPDNLVLHWDGVKIMDNNLNVSREYDRKSIWCFKWYIV